MSDFSQHFKHFLVHISNCGASPQTYTWALKRSLVGHDTKCVLPVRNRVISSSMPWLSASVCSFGESPDCFNLWHSCQHYQRTKLIIACARNFKFMSGCKFVYSSVFGTYSKGKSAHCVFFNEPDLLLALWSRFLSPRVSLGYFSVTFILSLLMLVHFAL